MAKKRLSMAKKDFRKIYGKKKIVYGKKRF